MSKWPTTALRGKIHVKHGFPFKGEHFQSKGTYVVLTPGNFHEQGGFKRNAEKDKCYSEPFPKEYLLNKGDIVVAMTEQAEGLLGSTALIPESGRFLHNQRLGLITAQTGEVLPEFIYHLFKTYPVRDQIRRTSSGSKVKHTSPERIYDVHVPLPPVKEQAAIAEIFTTIETKIALNHRINSELEGMAKLLYDYWFVQYDFPLSAAQAAALGKPRLTGKPYRSSGGPMVYHDQLKREIPKGWKVGDLEELCSMVRGVTYSKADVRTPTDRDTVPILRATNVNNGIVDLSDLVYVTEDMPSEDQYLEKFDILVVMSSGSKAHVGKNALYCYDRKVAYGAFCSKVVPNPSSRFFVAVHMQSDPFKKYISNVCRGTSINNLTNAHITKHQLPIPPPNQLQEFEKTVSNFFKTIACNHQQNQELTTLRDWLLPMLMNGQVRVTG